MNDRNVWAEEGLRAEWTDFQAASLSVAAVIAGELDFAVGGAESAVNVAVKGADVRITGVYQNKFEYHLIAARDIRTVQDLKGKTLGVARFGSSADFATRVLLKRYGLDPERDVTIVQVGNTAERVAALQAGGIQAALMGPDVLALMTRDGYPDLADMSKTDIRFPFQAVATSRTLLERRPEVSDRFLRAIYRGIKLFRDDPEGAQRVIAEQGGETNKEVLQALWDTYRNTFSTDLTPDPEVFALLIEELGKENPEFRNVASSQYLDTRSIERVNASGFPQTLFGTR
jgi:NitT/TauT family transport system substrate-binding protein